jgi:hypothetical protein
MSPAGYYTLPGTASTTSGNQDSQALCSPGFYCVAGVMSPCPPGTYGSSAALPTSACSGPCAPGFFCDGGAVSPTQHPCGSVAMYCPAGSTAPVIARPGEYTVGPTPSTRNSSVPCPSGSYCVGGLAAPCPAGRFGCADRLGDPSCNGLCTGGFYCPAGSQSSQAVSCGGSDTNPTAAALFCPPGSSAPSMVAVGFYSTDVGTAAHQRSGQALCPVGSYCSAGLLVSGSKVNSGKAPAATALCAPCH